jgi:D-glycero-beta-D-manno-heptose-7-phosphate kinase
MVPAAALLDLLPRLAGARVVLVGDLIADEYLFGKPVRISREAPVLILRFKDREVRLGGGANAAHNVHALGATVLPVGTLGEDSFGDEVATLFGRVGIATEGLLRAPGRMTPVKTRIMAGGYESTRQQVIRLDREPDPGLMPEDEERLLDRLRHLARDAHAFLISDYGYGTLTPRILETILELARRARAVVAVDSRYDLLRFRGVTAATPNEPELEALTGQELEDERAVDKAGRMVLDRLGAQLLLVTRGSRGMALFERDGPVTFIPIHGTDQIADVTGAGDTVISAFTVALAAGASPGQAAWLANLAGGIVVMKRGTATVSPAELAQALTQDGSLSQP